ncbi:MAG: glucose 1-dehydrogenase [Syntrophaceae bacterium]|nr:glucose 1-dehydrogenase [Syntrophaceae bacterium]
MGKFDEKTVVITGSGQGMGRHMAISFARAGANVVVNDRVAERLEKAVSDIRALGGKTIGVKADITKKQEVDHLINETLKEFKRIDIFVNNAGIARRADLLEMSEADWDDVMLVNLKAVFLCVQAVGKVMVQQKYGKIINMASVRGLAASKPDQVSYSTSKAGVIALTKEAAKALGPYSINVNAIAPSIVIDPEGESGMAVGLTPEQLQKLLVDKAKLSVIGRVGYPEDVANLALFLASDDASYITGQVIACCGGRNDKL